MKHPSRTSNPSRLGAISATIGLILGLFATACPSRAKAFQLPRSCTQCIVGTAADWNSSHATLQRFRKDSKDWHRVGNPIPARLGKAGLAWGLGLHPVAAKQPHKREGDGKAPAGIFEIGGVWGYSPEIHRHPELPYRRITPRDLWVEDPNHRLYNQHVVLDHNPASDWEKAQQMKQADPAHSLKLFIKHNAGPRIFPGQGSSIFFHIWRDNGGRPTAGCTTMAEANLREMIAWLDPGAHPLYILLPRETYRGHLAAWKLPALD